MCTPRPMDAAEEVQLEGQRRKRCAGDLNPAGAGAGALYGFRSSPARTANCMGPAHGRQLPEESRMESSSHRSTHPRSAPEHTTCRTSRAPSVPSSGGQVGRCGKREWRHVWGGSPRTFAFWPNPSTAPEPGGFALPPTLFVQAAAVTPGILGG